MDRKGKFIILQIFHSFLKVKEKWKNSMNYSHCLIRQNHGAHKFSTKADISPSQTEEFDGWLFCGVPSIVMFPIVKL